MATALTEKVGKIEVHIAAEGANSGYTELLGYTDLNLAHGDASMQSVVAGLKDFATHVIGDLTSRTIQGGSTGVTITYEFNVGELEEQWEE